MDPCEVFINKCRDNNYLAVETFLSSAVSPNLQNVEGETPLQVASSYGSFDIVDLLLKNGASVDLANVYGWTPLMHAAYHGHAEVLLLLIKKKAKVNISNRLGLRPIDLASWSGNLACVEHLIDAGAVIDKMPSSNLENDTCDLTALMAAALQGHDYILKTLLEKGSCIDQASSITDLTSLMLAACNGHNHIVQTLVEWGSDVNKVNKCNKTALDLAIMCNKPDIIAYLENVTVPNSAKSFSGVLNNTNILQIVRNGDIAQLKSLLQCNQNLCNYLDPEDGSSPLMIASMLGYNNIVDILISEGANINAQDTANGWTPLMYAVFHRQAETVHLLLDKGANVEICTINGYTALDLATHIDSSETDIVESLISHSARTELLDNYEYLVPSPNSSIKKNHLSVEKVSPRHESQTKIKDWIGGLSSHIRQLSKSSAFALSPAFDSPCFDETLSDVFLDNSSSENLSPEGKYLSISKLYAPNQHFAHLLKEQKVEAIILPPLPTSNDHIDLMKTMSPKKNKAFKNKHDKSFNSLKTPNLLKHYFQKRPLANTKQASKVEMTRKRSEVLDANDKTIQYDIEFSILEKAGESIKNQSPDTMLEGLTALLSKESLKKYAAKFRDQEIDIETFQHLTQKDLDEIGINNIESQKKLLDIISKLKQS